jgi:hypothetical protein
MSKGLVLSWRLLRHNTLSLFTIGLCVIIGLAVLSPAYASTSKQVTNVIAITNTFGFDIPTGMSVNMGISSVFSGAVSIKSPNGSIIPISFPATSGSFSSNVSLSQIGTYEVTENYTLNVSVTSLFGTQNVPESASGTWTFENTAVTVGRFQASSSVTNAGVGNIIGPITVALAGNSLPTSATINTTGAILQGAGVSATVTCLWNVASSVVPAPPVGTLEVQTNRSNATFSITGPANFSGGGTFWTNEAPVGQWTVTFGDIPKYITPLPQKGNLTLGGKLTFNGQYVPLTGTVRVQTNLDQATFSIINSEGNIIAGNGVVWSIPNAIIGQYSITYSDLSGYETPPFESKMLNLGETINFSGQYKLLLPGNIDVQTNLDSASFDLTGPATYSGSGKSWSKTNAPAGTYTITYKPVAGYETPSSEAKQLPSGGSLSFSGQYSQIFPGTIEVHANIDGANFSITGPSNYSGNGKLWTQDNVPIGNYIITYGAVADYKTPNSETKKLASGGTIIFNADYQRLTGTLVVKTNLSQATFSLTGQASYNGSGTDWSKTGAPVGDWTITYGSIPNYETPSPSTSRLNANSTLTFVGEYRQIIPGSIEVATNNADSTFSISGPGNYNGSGLSWKQTNVQPGEYTITYSDIANYNKPVTEIKTLPSGGSILFNGEYIPHKGSLKVSTNLDGASFAITGGNSYAGTGKSWTQTGVPVGNYTIIYDNKPYYSSPPSETKEVKLNEETGFSGTYNPSAPQITRVTVTGSPANANSTVRITVISDPGCETTFSISGIASGTLTELTTPGTYTTSFKPPKGIEATNVPVDVKVKNPLGLESTDSSQKVSVDTLAQILSVTLSNANPAYNELVTITMTGDPYGSANFSISGVMQDQMSENTASRGTYTGGFTVQPTTPKGTFPVEVKLMDGVGNFASNSDQKITIAGEPGTINVSTNLAQATFNLTGAANYSGSGTSWTQSNASAGQYTMTYNAVQGWTTPPSESKTLPSDGTIAFNGNYIAIPGNINVTTNLASATFSVLHVGSGTTYNGSGLSWDLSNASTGQYTVTYGEVDGYTTPPSQTQTLVSGATITFDEVYNKIPSGTVEITTNKSTATFTVTHVSTGTAHSGSGLSWKWLNAPIGDYSVTFGSLTGYVTPAPQLKALADGGTASFNGEYALPPSGTVEVTTNESTATFTVTHVPTGTIQVGSGLNWKWLNSPIGDFVVVFSDVAGFKTPAGQTLNLVANATISFIGEYSPLPQPGNIEVVTNQTEATFMLTYLGTGSTYQGNGLSFGWTGMSSGQYMIAYGGVYGFIAPASETMSLGSGQTIQFDGQYTPAPMPGIINVATNLISATFTVTNVATSESQSGSGLTWRWIGASPGVYTVTFGNVSGYGTPAMQTKTMSSGGVITFDASYGLVPGTIRVRTNLEIAEFELNGPAVYNGSGLLWTQANAAQGEYTITYENIAGYVAPPPETKALTSDGSLNFIGVYTVDTGTLKVYANIDGAIFNITGPASYSGSGREWGQTQVPPGNYTITYQNAVGYNTPPSETKELKAGNIIAFNGLYDPIYGTIIVRTNLDSAKFSLVGPAVYNGEGKNWESDNILPGEYTIQYESVDGYQTPLSETKTLSAGSSIGFIGGYSPIQASPVSTNFRNVLMQNFPNPCNPETWIPFSLANGAEVSITIYDINGRKVRRLELGYKNPGIYVKSDKSAYWDGRNEYGEKVVSGVYFYNIKAGNFTATRRMLILR